MASVQLDLRHITCLSTSVGYSEEFAGEEIIELGAKNTIGDRGFLLLVIMT